MGKGGGDEEGTGGEGGGDNEVEEREDATSLSQVSSFITSSALINIELGKVEAEEGGGGGGGGREG